MAELKIKVNDIDLLVAGIKESRNSIDTSVSNINNPSKCSGIMISAYVDRIIKISKLIDLYKDLLERDTVDILYSKDKIIEMDKKLTNKF